MSGRPRVVIASPDRVEVGMLADWLASDGLEPVALSRLQSAIHEVHTRSYDVLVADFVFAADGGLHAIARNRNARAPLVLLGDTTADAERYAERHGAFCVSRPIDRAMLSCLVSMAIAEGRPSRRSVRKAIGRFEAVAHGVPSFLIDVSNEGLRLEIPRSGRAAPPPPPSFSVRVPAIGVSLLVQRVWMAAPEGQSAERVAWCGGALQHNPAHALRGWRTFVDAFPTSC